MPPPDPARERLFRAVAVACLLGSAAAVVGLLLLPRTDPAPDTGPGPGRVGTRSSAVHLHRVSPFADLTRPEPLLREHALRPRPQLEAWLADKTVTPQERTAAAALLRKALADDVPAVRLAAAELVASTKTFAEVPPAEGAAAAEKFLGDPDATMKVRAGAAVWGVNGSPAAAKLLLGVLADKSVAVELRKRAAKPNVDGTPATLERILADTTDDTAMRWHALDKLKTAPLTDSLKQVYAGVCQNTTDQIILRDYSFRRLTADLKPGAVPDSLRPLVLAFTAPDSPVVARVRAFGLLEPQSERFAKTHPELAKSLQAAGTDAKEESSFRAFAALFFNPATANDWAAAVRVLAETEAETQGVRRALAGRLAEVFAGKPIPKEWITAEVAKAMAKCPSDVPGRTGRAEYTPAGEVAGKDDPKQTAERSRALNAAFRDGLIAAGPDVIPALADGVNVRAVRTRNLEALAKLDPKRAEQLGWTPPKK